MSSTTATPPVNPIPSPARPSWGNRVVMVFFAAVVTPVVLTLLYLYPPADYPFSLCWFHWLTGLMLPRALHCPGCGATRSVHSLLHGDLLQAFAYNPLFVILLPLLAYGIVRVAYNLWTGQYLPGPVLSARGTWILLGILLLFWIIRNIDIYPFTLLAPHTI